MGRLLGVAFGVLASSVLLVLSLPPALGNALGWLCMVPVLVSVNGTRFGIGFIAGLACCLLAAQFSVEGWFYPASQFATADERLSGDAAWHFMGFLFLGVAAGAVSGVFAELRKLSATSILGLALVAVTVESATLLVLPCHLGLSQFRSMAMMRTASVAGLWGVTLVVWASNIAFAGWLASARQGDRRVGLTWMAAAAFVVSMVSWLTQYALQGPDGANTRWEGRARSSLRLAALQTRSGDADELARLSSDGGAWLTVWPELSGTGAALGGDPSGLVARAMRHSIRFATSYQDDARPKPHNTLAVFSGAGESERYHKRKLFGGEAAMHSPGAKAVAVRVDGVDIGLNVCYDSCFAALIRDTAREPNVRFIVLPSMGPESPNGFVQAVHGAFTTFRSAECGIAIARAETSAYAMITDCDGRILTLGPPGFQGTIMADVPALRRQTACLYLGDWVLYLSWMGVGAWVLRAILARARVKGGEA